jgi:DNA replication protein DnaC
MEGVLRMLRCRCQRIPDRVALFNLAHLPARHAGSTMESFQHHREGPRGSWEMTRRWLETFKPGDGQMGLVLYGEPGRGKTHLMCAVLRELIFRHGMHCRFVEFTHLLSAIREGIDKHDSDATTITPLTEAPILAIDELGKGRKTEFELSVIDELVTRRYNARKLIIATTNFPLRRASADNRANGNLAVGGLETLQERLGERVFSRLRETAWVVEVGGEDFRVTKGR